jgi:hypothetical protein
MRFEAMRRRDAALQGRRSDIKNDLSRHEENVWIFARAPESACIQHAIRLVFLEVHFARRLRSMPRSSDPMVSTRSGFRSRILGFGGLAGGVALLGFNLAGTPVAAQTATGSTANGPECPVVSLANPNPGDFLAGGGYIVSGTAFDPIASQGPGVSRIDFFLGSRDQGGLFLGSAVPGAGANARDFQVQLTIPSSGRSNGTDFVAYAYDASSSGETTVSVPVFIDTLPPSAESSSQPPASVTSNCSSMPAMAPVAAAASTPVPGAASTSNTPSLTSTGEQRAPVLQLANPSQNDLLPPGGYIISGVAYDPTSTNGGIDRIEFFIDPRDEGGLSLGSVTPGTRAFQTEVNIPNSMHGGHTFVAYAHSSITGAETMVSVPVFVDVMPAPTPRP